MIFNLTYGKSKVATITVNTNAGATVTCELAPYSFTATADSSGVATFAVPKAGTWNITCTFGGSTQTGTVTITEKNGDKSTTIMVGTYLIQDGVRKTTWTESTSGGSITDQSSSNNRIRFQSGDGQGLSTYARLTSANVSFTGKSRLYIVYSMTTDSSNAGASYGTKTASSSSYSTTSLSASSTRTSVYKDISSLTGNYNIRLGCNSSNGPAHATLYIYDVYLV